MHTTTAFQLALKQAIAHAEGLLAFLHELQRQAQESQRTNAFARNPLVRQPLSHD